MSAQIVIATLALVLAILSLLWQAWTYQRSGTRFTVETAFGFLAPTGKGLISYRGVPPLEALADRAPGTGQAVIICTVRNTGRLAGSVVAWRINTVGVESFIPGRNLFGENLPATVGADERIQLVCEYRSARGLVDVACRKGADRTVRAVVETGGGRVIESGPLTIP